MKLINFIRDWSEVWALLIPLIIILVFKPAKKQLRPVILYVFAGFILNFLATFMVEYYYLMPSWTYTDGYVNNNILYNLHSFVRVLFLGWYIISVRQYKFPFLLKTLLIFYLVFVITNFTFYESPFILSTRLYAAESITLLVICLFYFFRSMQDESDINWLKHPSFLIAAGISLYEVITFFIFLFFYPLHQKDISFAAVTMRIYTITFVVFCILLALALYKSRKKSNLSGVTG